LKGRNPRPLDDGGKLWLARVIVAVISRVQAATSVSREGIEPSTRGLKVPCSATELPAQPGWSLPNIVGSWDVDALPFGIAGTFGTPGEVEGSGELYHEPPSGPRTRAPGSGILRADGLLRFGGHRQDATYDGYEPDQEERLSISTSRGFLSNGRLIPRPS
jgi:hypothetical protein